VVVVVVVVGGDDWSLGWHSTLLLLKGFDMTNGRSAFGCGDVEAHLSGAEL
jgi:hypothetical protein